MGSSGIGHERSDCKKDFSSTEEELLAKEERLESAIHIIRTLKSVNDTSLSDWRGVIGEELEEIREEQAEKEAEIQDLVSRLEDVVAHQNEGMKGNFEHTELLRRELESLRKDIRMAIAGSSISTLTPKSVRKAKKETVKVSCPKCGAEIAYKQRPNGHFKTIRCVACDSKFISTSIGNGIALEPRESKKESVKCPQCDSINEILLDNAPGAFLKCQCSKCKQPFRISRSPANRELIVRPVVSGSEKFDESIVELVRKELPPQPWPKGTHFAVARKLGIPPAFVSKATDELIKRGVFVPQVDGVLFAQNKVAATDKTDESEEGE